MACFEPTTQRCARAKNPCVSPTGTAARTARNFAEYMLGLVLLYRDATERGRGLELMVRARDWQQERIPSLVPVTEVWIAREMARRHRDKAIVAMRTAVEDMPLAERPGYAFYGTSMLVEALLERAAEGDLTEAQEAIDQLAHLRTDEVWAMRDIWLLRLRTLMARARGDDVIYRELVGHYRQMAKFLGFEGHIAWAEAMTE
jgi:hypothetical protein